MNFKKFIFILAAILIISSPIYAFQTKEAKVTVSAPLAVQAGDKFRVTFDIRYSGVKEPFKDICWPVPISCPIGLFLKVKWNNVEYRIADTVTTDTSKNIYWPYPFDGSIFTKKVSLTLTAPDTPGKYTIYAQLYVNERAGADDAVASGSFVVSVMPKPEEEVVYERKETSLEVTPTPTPTTPECKVSVSKINVIPSAPYENQPTDLLFKIDVNCPGGESYGPYVKINIKDALNREVYCFRIGDQGYTDCAPINEPNYYFKPGVYSKEISITGLKFKEGLYKIYVTVKYSKPFARDPVIVEPYLASTFKVYKRTESIQQVTPVPKECTGRPILYMATWSDENRVVKLSTNVNSKIYALIYFKNPYSTCTYIGEVKVDIRKHISMWPDKTADTKVVYVKIPPNSDKIITLEFVPTEAGEYHYDVYWNENKYSGKDVSKHYSKIVRGTSDVLIVKEIKEVKPVTTKEAKVTLLAAWFEKDGKRVYQVPENTLVRACVNLTAAATIDGIVTINVKTLAGMPQFGLIGDVAPDPTKYTYRKAIVLSPGNVTTVCTNEFMVRQSSALHNEQYYVEVLFNDEKLGIYPESKDGLIVIPKTGKGNPLIKGQDELANLVVLSHGWYASDGSLVSGTVPPGTYYVKAIVQNTGTADFTGTVTIVLKEDKDLQIDPTVATCPVNLIVKVNETKEISCSFNLEDGKTYHYEILVGDKKLVSRGPSIKVRSWWNIWAWISDVFHGTVKGVIFNPWTIIGAAVLIIIIIVVIITAPHWVPGVIAIIRLWRELYRR